MADGARCHRCGATIAPPGRRITPREDLLVGTLATSVLIETDYARRLPWSDVQRIAADAASIVASHGDDLQFGGKQCRKAFAALTRGLAALSFAPGGVTFLGGHWCARHPESTATEGQYAAREVV